VPIARLVVQLTASKDLRLILFTNEKDEISKALRMMKKGKSAGSTGNVFEMFMADEDGDV